MVVANLYPGFNANSSLGQWETLVDLLCDRAASQPHQIYRFLLDGEQDEQCLTYAELDLQARAIATHIQSLPNTSTTGVVGERALLLYPPGLEFVAAFFGCLYAGVIPVPAYLPRNNRHQYRVKAIAQDAQALFMMTTSNSLESVRSSLASPGWYHSSQQIVWISTDSVSVDSTSAALAESWSRPGITEDNLALLQYTSGATGKPKGVMVSHHNLLHNLAQIYLGFEHNADSRGLSWLPPHHDMGLIGGILQPLFGGFPITLMSPVHFLQQPKRWLEAITRYGITSSGGPNFAYDLCIKKITSEQRATLDLSNWDVAFTGAEPVQLHTLEKFAQVFAECGFQQRAFYPCYGLAEATLFVTGGHKDKAPTIQSQPSSMMQDAATTVTLPRVSCGQPLLEQTVLIVDPKTCKVCDSKQVGEIWVAGESVAQGYWQRPDETATVFHASLASSSYGSLGMQPEASFLRTGDLGFLSEDALYITGRIKDVIIIRGQNHYPQDIEATIAQCHPALRQSHGAVFSVEDSGKNGQEPQEQIVVVQEIERTWIRKLKGTALASEMMDAIRAAVSHHHALQLGAIALVKPNSIPKTSSGKIQRQLCKASWLAGSLEGIIKAEDGGRKAEIKAEGRRQKAENSNSILSHPLTPPLPNSPSQFPNLKSEVQNSKAQSLIHWLQGYAEHHINSQLMDERRAIAPHILLDFGNQGLLGMQVPQSYGGLALGHVDTMQVLQQMGAIDTTLSLFVGLNNVLGIRPILKYGTAELQDELLPQLATGRELAAFALTEPEAGSNPRSIQSQAVPSDATDHPQWLLSGTKIWSGSAAWAGVINVFVQHHLADGTLAGISGFAVRKGSPGLRQGPEALTMGMRSMVQNTVYLDQVPVGTSQLLGHVGQGMSVAQDAMMYGRLAIASASVGGMKRCVQLMVRYSSRRSISTGRLLDNPVTLTRLNDITMAITAVETLVGQVAHRLDQGETIPVAVYTTCKIAAPELFWQAADTLVQTLGGRGYIETNIAPQILRDARVLRIFEGPTETLEMFLGARVAHVISQASDQDSNAVLPWLRDTLGVPSIADCLVEAVTRVRHEFGQLAGTGHFSATHASQHLTSQQWAFTWIGKLTTWAIFWAALENAFAHPFMVGKADSIQNRRELERSHQWVQQQFNHTLKQALWTATNQGTTPSSAHILDIAAAYETSIGNIEQASMGEERELDSWLKRDRDVHHPHQGLASVQGESESLVISESSRMRHTTLTTSEANDAKPSSNGLTLKSVQSWLVHWLSDRLKVEPAQINRQKSFADYGIDSVMAVELAQDLEDWLGEGASLDVTVAWSFPTIDTLAEYLSDNYLKHSFGPSSHSCNQPLETVQEAKTPVAGEFVAGFPDSSTSKLLKDNRNELSKSANGHYGLSKSDRATEAELAQLLAVEIAKVRQRGDR
ncbi:MAG: AMP-binding protein [Cyanothece sp. SIO2G6]|nr:AMP-binding protein [Cyanothece sp. SIO2G6]